MNNKSFQSAGLAAALILAFVNPALADSVYAQGDRILFADDNLFIMNADNSPSVLEEIVIGDATDVTVSDCKAIVTTNDGESKQLQVVDLSNNENLPNFCDYEEENECMSTFIPDTNTLVMPCVDVFGTTHMVKMQRRGNSPNWKVTFYEKLVE